MNGIHDVESRLIHRFCRDGNDLSIRDISLCVTEVQMFLFRLTSRNLESHDSYVVFPDHPRTAQRTETILALFQFYAQDRYVVSRVTLTSNYPRDRLRIQFKTAYLENKYHDLAEVFLKYALNALGNSQETVSFTWKGSVTNLKYTPKILHDAFVSHITPKFNKLFIRALNLLCVHFDKVILMQGGGVNQFKIRRITSRDKKEIKRSNTIMQIITMNRAFGFPDVILRSIHDMLKF